MQVPLDEDAYRKLKTVLSNVLHDVAPRETAKFEKNGTNMLREAYSNRKKVGRRSLRTRGFPGVVETGVVSIHLISGTLALIEIFRRKKERREQLEFEQSIQQEWRKALIKAGMQPRLADYIPVKYSSDVIRFIASQQLPRADE